MRESGALTRISRRREKERRAGGDKRNGDHLPDAETPERGAGIAAHELHAEADDPVSREIRGACAAATLQVEREEKREEDEKRGRLEELRDSCRLICMTIAS